jgi:hypothetical protein
MDSFYPVKGTVSYRIFADVCGTRDGNFRPQAVMANNPAALIMFQSPTGNILSFLSPRWFMEWTKRTGFKINGRIKSGCSNGAKRVENEKCVEFVQPMAMSARGTNLCF